MIRAYYEWLHGRWPAGRPEPLPSVALDGASPVVGVRVAGDLTGSPLLTLAADGGAAAVRGLASEVDRASDGELDLLIAGAGVAGCSAALEARRLGLRFLVVEPDRPLQTLRDFPPRKPIHLVGEVRADTPLRLAGATKEELLAHLEPQLADLEITRGRVSSLARGSGSGRSRSFVVGLSDDGGTREVRARSVLLAMGRAGGARTLEVPGGQRAHVLHRLLDSSLEKGRDVVVVGGGDSAVEAAVALHDEGARVVLAHRGERLVRPKPENLAALDARPTLVVLARTNVVRVEDREVVVAQDGAERSLPAERVYALLGRLPPIPLLRSLGLEIRGERTPRVWALTALAVALASFVYVWKAGGALTALFEARAWFPFGLGDALAVGATEHGLLASLRATAAVTLEEPGFHYSLAYTLAVVGFGLRRVRRRPTPYVRRQTATLVGVQVVLLFLVPYVLLPTLGHLGAFDEGVPRALADALFPETSGGHGREYWRAFGLVLAWPLFVWNVFTDQPMWAWLILGCLQTFVVIPFIVWRWGKGAYCGWICSCGALAETVGDGLRERMPHGPGWNRLQMLGQLVLAAALALLALRMAGWVMPGSWAERAFRAGLSGGDVLGLPLDYYHLVDVLLAGILGVGLYVGFSGRTWCRFACPLAALMHVYARFSRFRIFADKARCISCGACTAGCHQGIDVMAFAQRGAPMEDPQCVRCSACVESCPTGALAFGRLGADGPVLDGLPASLVVVEGGRTHLRVVRGGKGRS
jgi:thioredoxin reductase/ferredoxin